MCKKMIIVLLCLLFASVSFSGTLAPNHYYTWAIPEPNIPDGSIITNVVIELFDMSPGTVHVYLVDNPPIGWIKNIGTLSMGTYMGQAQRLELNSLSIKNSWADKIFTQPYSVAFPTEVEGGFEHLVMNAALMEYIDYAGNSTPSGLLLRCDDLVQISHISVTLTIRAFVGSYYKDVQTYNVQVPVDLAILEKWADEERLKLMQEYYIKMQELEATIKQKLVDG